MINRWRSFFALVLALVMTSACSQGLESPTEPTPVSSPPAESSVRLDGTNPATGSTLRAQKTLPNGYNDGDDVLVIVHYTVSEEHLAEAKRSGDDVAVTVCLSADGETTILGGCSSRRTPSMSVAGVTDHRVGLHRERTNVTETRYILVTMKWSPKSGIPRLDGVFLTDRWEARFFWNYDW